MSRASQSSLALPETAVRNPSRYGKELHRLDPEGDEIRPDVDDASDRSVFRSERAFGPLRERYPHLFDDQADAPERKRRRRDGRGNGRMIGQVAPATNEARAWLYYAPVETDEAGR